LSLLVDLTPRSVISYWHDAVVSICLYISVRPSVRLSVTLCIAAKWYILLQKCSNKWRGSAPYEHYLTFNPYADLGRQICREMIVRKSRLKTTRHRKQTSVRNCK